MDNWSFNNPIKVKLVEALSCLGIKRNLMIQCTEITYFLPIENLEVIYENLSKKQKKAQTGRAILEIINFKKNHPE
jgi:uncharacterized protein (DUF169 family)